MAEETAVDSLGRIGMDVSVSDLVGSIWDVVVVGAGHNGLTAAAYLAGAGRRVAVLERRDHVGGACTLEEPWPGYRVSPCAYVLGLLHHRVIQELDLGRRIHVTELDPQLYVVLADGSVFVEWLDEERTVDDLRRWAPDQVDGYREFSRFTGRVRKAIRGGEDDLWWRSVPPSRSEVESRLGDADLISAVFEESMEAFLGRFFTDHRLVDALAGQGVVGSTASPRDPGTAWMYLHHALGGVGDDGGGWGFVSGGIGMVSFALADAAREAGALIATGRGVAEIRPGFGVVLETGHEVRARVVVSNADPARTVSLLGDDAPRGLVARVAGIPRVGASGKVNLALSGLPFTDERANRAMVNVGGGVERLDSGARLAARGELPGELWAELYLQSYYDQTVAPAGKHVLSCFVQPLPYDTTTTWDASRPVVLDTVVTMIDRVSPGFAGLVEHSEVQGPADIERRVGLSGGHIFHGELLPQHMWEGRVPYRSGAPGVYLCGAGTHPGGSVIAANGRNAAMCVLEDL